MDVGETRQGDGAIPVRSFVAVSRFPISHAQRSIIIMPPAMTKAVQKLEYELGRLSCDALGYCDTRISDCGGVYARASASRPHSHHQCYLPFNRLGKL